MADPWEVSVVLALRDLQWIMHTMNKTFPAPSISLSGKAESRLGDSLLSAAGRFFYLK